jgi:hypothetical protein
VVERLMDNIKTRKLKFCGHIMKHDILQKFLLEGRVDGNRASERQRLTWFDNIKGWIGKSYEETTRMAKFRNSWRSMVANLQNGDDT